MVELEEKDIRFFDEDERYIFIRIKTTEDFEQLKQQILDDYEKARKYDELVKMFKNHIEYFEGKIEEFKQ